MQKSSERIPIILTLTVFTRRLIGCVRSIPVTAANSPDRRGGCAGNKSVKKQTEMFRYR
jgi:hypothetical protein